jgi:hypothetical protein
MGMFGSRANMSASQQVSRGGDGMDPKTARPTFFEQGGAGRPIAGYLGDALLNLSGNKPIYGPMVTEQRQQDSMLQRQMALAQWKMQNPEPTGTMQNVAATGVQPGTPEYQQRMLKAVMQPHYVMFGNAEQGQTLIDANNPPQGGGSPPKPTTQQEYDALPPGSTYIDKDDGQVYTKGGN